MKELLFKNYTRETLVTDEYVVFETSKHWINFFNKTFFWGLILSIIFYQFFWIFLLFCLFNVANVWILIQTDECVVTTKRVIFKTGMFLTKTIELNLNKIESLSVEQSILGQLLGYGTITIRGTGGTCETFFKINQPLEIRRKVQEYSF